MVKFPENLPCSVVQGTVYRNAYVGDMEVCSVEVTLDSDGVHGSCVLDGERVFVTRLNSRLDYSFDAPDTVCPIRSRSLYEFHMKTP